MSLAVLADHLASKGRNGDTMLVHMTPGEVQGLHALALAHGGKLTINPDTGLPEASFLKKLLPMIAGMALNAFLPGVGSAIGSMLPGALGLSAATAGAIGTGIAVGGITGLARGSLKEGILAGLGAYGGASLGAGLTAAGAASAEQAALNSITPEQIAEYSKLNIPKETLIGDVTRQAGLDYAKANPFSQLGQGLGALTEPAGRSAFMTGVGGTSGLTRAGLGVAAGMDALGQPQTVTKQPGAYKMYRRPMAFDQATQTFEPLPITSATEPAPTGMNSGGIVALADGGPTAAQLAAQQSIVNDPQAAALAAARSGIAAGMTNEQIANMVNMQYGKNFSAQNVADFMAANQLTRPAAPAPAAYVPPTTITSTDPTQQALPTAAQYAEQKRIEANPQAAALAAARTGIAAGMTDQQIANMVNQQYGKTFSAQNVADFMAEQGLTRPTKPEVPVIPVTPTPDLFPGTTPGVISTGEPFTPVVQTMEQVRSAYEQGGGSTKMPTITDIKPTDRTYTQNETFALLQGYLKANPNALYGDVVGFARSKGIPEMQARAAYNEFRFSGLTGGSQQAYDYLMGRGAYPVKPFLPAGTPVMRPYAESVGLAPPQFYSGRKLSTDSSGNVTTGSSTTTTSGSGAKVQWRNEGTGELVSAAKDDPRYKDDPSWRIVGARGGLMDFAPAAARGGDVQQYNLGGYSDGGRLLRGPGDGVSDSIPATIGNRQPARLADGEFVVPARIVSEIGNGSTEAGARKLYAMMDRVQRARAKTTGKGKVAKNTSAEKYLPA